MNKQWGFTLTELMVIIGTIAILSAISTPACQNYLCEAALTGILQTLVPYRMAVGLYALEHDGTDACDVGTNGIPSLTTTRYVSVMSVEKGTASFSGQESPDGLSITVTPDWDNVNGTIGRNRNCVIQNDSALQQACEGVLRSNAH